MALQEVPLWAVGRLAEWTGMQVLAERSKRALLGPAARAAHRLDARWFRSSATGQATALLVATGLAACPLPPLVLRRRGRLEARVCQLAEVEGVLVANVHASNRPGAAREELERLAAGLPASGPCVVCADVNLPGVGLLGFTEPLPGIDQILVRGLAVVEGPAVWPEERRRVNGVLLSDHPPVELRLVV